MRHRNATQRAADAVRPRVKISVQNMGTILEHGKGGGRFPNADQDLYDALVPWVEDLPGWEQGDTIHIELTTGN